LIAATDGAYTDKVLVSWPDVDDEDSYKVFRCTTINTATCIQIAALGTDVTSYDDTDAEADGKVHYYRVRACATSGCSTFSEPDSGYRAKPENIFTDGFEDY